MKGFTKLEAIEYKIFEKGIKVSKSVVMKKYRSETVLAYDDLGENLKVYCEIHISAFDVRKIEKDIKSIRLPESMTENIGSESEILLDEDIKSTLFARGFRYLSTVSSSVAIRYSDEMAKILSWLSQTPLKFRYYSDVEDKSASKYLLAHYWNSSDDVWFNADFCGEINCFANASYQIKEWLNRTSYNEFYTAIRSKVIGQSSLKHVVTDVFVYLSSIAENRRICRSNTILAAPSGCGKTETYRALKEYFKKEIPALPVSLIDTNQITPEGFRGMNTSYIVKDFRPSSESYGIIFLDEFDKRLIPSYEANGTNVNAEVQAQLLLAVEGINLNDVDTSKILFIGMGSFNKVRTMKAEKVREKKFGLGIDRPDTSTDLFSNITREDMIELGASYELIGRFSSVINYERLSYEQVDEIIDLRVKELSEEYCVSVSVGDGMRKLLHDNSNTEFGNRLITSLLREAICNAITEILTRNIDEAEIVLTDKGSYQINEPARFANRA